MESIPPRKSDKWEVKAKQLMLADNYERFCEKHGGVYPASIAAIKLRMSPQGVYQAAQRGWLDFFSVGRDRWYSRKDVLAYRFTVSKKYRDCRPLPPYPPRSGESATS